MEEAIYPELNYRMFIKCSKGDLIDIVVEKASHFAHLYDSVAVSDKCVTFETRTFTNLLCAISFYKSAVSIVDNIPFEEVCENAHLNSITLEIEYVSPYWADRCMQEMTSAICQCGLSCTLASSKVEGNVASVICTSWDALFNMDQVIMKAGHGYSKPPDCQPSCADSSPEVKTDVKPFLVSGACMLAVIIFLICLA